MPYRFKSSDPSLSAGMRRIAAEQLDRGLAALEGAEDIHESLHDARKRAKKLRGLLRLLRASFPGYSAENGYLRDAARLVSGLRDRTAMIEALDRLMASPAAAELPGDAVTDLRAQLVEARDAAMALDEAADRLSAFRGALEAVRRSVPDWTLEDEGWDAIEPGLVRSLKRARKAMAVAVDGGDDADRHEWRKRVKYHWYHARLLQMAWPAAVKVRADAADRLGEMLGDRHDLDVLDPLLVEAEMPEDRLLAFREVLDAERARLDAAAGALGARLLAEKPRALAGRWRAWWEAPPLSGS